jgi:hypothetical protein
MFCSLLARADAVLAATLVLLLGIKSVPGVGPIQPAGALIVAVLLAPRVACYFWCKSHPWLTSMCLVITYPVVFFVAMFGFSEGCMPGGVWSFAFLAPTLVSSVYAFIWMLVSGWQRLVQHAA